MITTILILSLSQVPYGPQAQWGWDGSVQNRTCWGDRPGNCYSASRRCVVFIPLPSPWNAAVAELRAAGPRRSSDKRPPGEIQQQLASLEARRADLYDQLRAAEPQSKAALRAEWLQARQDLEHARLQAARLARR